MRSKVLASLLILCGSTAAVASISATPQDTMTNNMVAENTTDEPAPPPSPAPNDTAPDNTTDDAPPQF